MPGVSLLHYKFQLFQTISPVMLNNGSKHEIQWRKRTVLPEGNKPKTDQICQMNFIHQVTGCTELFFVEPGGEGQRRLLQECPVDGEDVSSDLGDVKRLLHLPAGQRTSISSKEHHCVTATWNTNLHWTGTLTSKLTRPQSSWLLIWGLIQERVYQRAIRDIDELKERLIVVWAELRQTVIDKAIEQWRPRLRACVQAKGHHFEHLIKWHITFFLLNIRLAFHHRLLPNYNWLSFIEDFWKVFGVFLWGTVYIYRRLR